MFETGVGRVRSVLAGVGGRRLAVGAVGVAAMMVAGFLVASRPAQSELEQSLGDGAVWLTSKVMGGVSLVDGASGTMITDLQLARSGDDLEAFQWGPTLWFLTGPMAQSRG